MFDLYFLTLMFLIVFFVLTRLKLTKKNKIYLIVPFIVILLILGFINTKENYQSGKCKKKSYRCPHAGCQAKWNKNKNVFRCPCHGSEFDKDGTVLKGPAQQNLKCI